MGLVVARNVRQRRTPWQEIAFRLPCKVVGQRWDRVLESCRPFDARPCAAPTSRSQGTPRRAEQWQRMAGPRSPPESAWPRDLCQMPAFPESFGPETRPLRGEKVRKGE